MWQPFHSEGILLFTHQAQHEHEEDDKCSITENDESSDDEPPGGSSPTSNPTVEEGPSGIIVEGNWREVSETCMDFTNKLAQTHSGKSSREKEQVEEWINWYPREGDDKEELKKRTAKQAKFDPEQKPKKRMEESTTELDAFREHFQEFNLPRALENLGEASKTGASAFFSFLGQSIADLEEFIYHKIVVQTNPLYFDNSLLSASFREINRFQTTETKQYQLTIKVHDRALKRDLHELVVSEN
ncbi:MAG: DUF5828 family protein [Candidatus Bipolaricaulota bacterium]